jgi:hypothetical protein
VCTYLSYLLPWQYRNKYGVCAKTYLFNYSKQW